MTSLVAQVSDRLAALTSANTTCVVAVSGGRDSLALLDLLWRGRNRHGRALVIGHVDHGITTEPGAGLARIQQWQARVGAEEVPVEVVELALGAAASETLARQHRRRALLTIADRLGAESIVLAHQAEDQAETLLLRVLRGSGPAGLAAMAPRQGRWVRPLLDLPRQWLEEHLTEVGLTWWEDPANADPRHLRSWLRTEILPRMTVRLPDLPKRLAATSRQAAAARAAWDDLLDVLPDLSFEQSQRGISVAASPLRGYSSVLRGALLGALGRRVGVLLAARRLRAVDRLLTGAAGGIDLAPGWRAEVAFGRLRLVAVGASLPIGQDLVDGVAWDEGRFLLRNESAGRSVRGGWSAWFLPGRYRIRPWQVGDRIRPLGGRGSRPVGVLLKEARVAPGDRRRHPLVVTDDGATILWVPGICRSEDLVPPAGTEAIHVEYARAASEST